MKYNYLILLTFLLLQTTPIWAMEKPDSGEHCFISSGYTIRLMYRNPSINELKKIEPGELGLFSENNKLYCKTYKKEKIKIIKSNNLSVGYPTESFDRVMRTLGEIIKPDYMHVALAQEKEGDPELANFSYNLAFESITESDKEELFQYMLLRRYIKPDISKIENAESFWNIEKFKEKSNKIIKNKLGGK